MEAIILAGGMGTRLQSVVKDIPKPMAPVCNKPFLEFILRKLAKHNFKRIILAVGYRAEIIMNYFQNEYLGMEIIYSHEDEPLGTGGCIKKALQLTSDDYIFIINGDTYFDIDLEKMKTTKDIMMACKYMEAADRYGIVKIKNDNVIGFSEKKPNQTGYINGGIYLVKRDLFRGHALPDKFSLEAEFFEKHINELKIEPFLSKEYFIDIGIPSDYAKVQEDFKNV